MEGNSHLVASRYLSRNKPSSPYIYIYQSRYHRDTRFYFPNRHDACCMWHARSKRQSIFRVVKFRTLEILITWMHRENFIIFFYYFSPKNLLFSSLLFPSECGSIFESRFPRDLPNDFSLSLATSYLHFVKLSKHQRALSYFSHRVTMKKNHRKNSHRFATGQESSTKEERP